MIETLLSESKDLEILLSSIEKLKDYCYPDTIEGCTRKVLQKYANYP